MAVKMDNPPIMSHSLPYNPPSTAYPPPLQPSTVSFAPQPSFVPPPQPTILAEPYLAQSPVSMGAQSIRATKSTAEFSLREYMTLQRRRYRTDEVGIEERLRLQSVAVVRDLRAVREDVAEMVRAAERHRWRRWLLGGLVGSFIPLVKRLFRRPEEEHAVSNDTEYAFGKSKTLISRILDSVHGKSGLASVAFFVFAVLYVFQNEVSLTVAKTVSRRLKRLAVKVERGDEELSERDMELLRGWRWRVLLWGQ